MGCLRDTDRVASPTIDELTLAGSPDPWRDVGFDVEDDALEIGTVRIRFAGNAKGRGIVECTMRDIELEEPDGLPIHRSNAPVREARADPHPNGAVSLDHLVAFCAGLDRTIPALEDAGLELRRLREEPTPAGAPRQAFFRLAEVILEVIEAPPGSHEERNRDAKSRFWGLAFSVNDLDASAEYLGERLGTPRDAVQPGRRIATVRRETGLGTAVAFMTPDPRVTGVRS
jgi:hypothetical protein